MDKKTALKPKALLSQFLSKWDRKVRTKQREYTNGMWLLKPGFAPKQIKDKIGAGNDCAHLDSKTAWDCVNWKKLEIINNIVGYTITCIDSISYIFYLKGDRKIGIQKKYYDYLKRHIPMLILKASEPESPVVIYSGNKIAGLVAPINL